jgi:uncharacterized protein with FMN-binding domain
MASDAGPQISDPMLERLERLAARQGRTRSTRPLPPPTPGPSPSRSTTGRTRRRHPARAARIGALLASCATTGGLTYFFAGTNTSQASSPIPGLVSPITTAAAAPSAATVAPSTPAVTATTAPATTATTPTAATPTTTAPATTAASSVDVIAFDGDTIQTKFGPVQVQAQIQNGGLVAVAVVQYPDADGKSVRINERALPELQSEALAAQSAQVDTVSGATYTSNAYTTSLQSAIDEALAAGAITA